MDHRWQDTTPPSEEKITALIAEIEERSYVVIPNVISPAEADEARTALEALAALRRGDTTPEGMERVGEIAVKHPIFRDLLCHPLPVTVWKRFLGVDMFCSTWTGVTLHPGYKGGGWHADYPFWSLKEPYIADNIATQTIWLLDDFTAENGGTGVVPGGHKLGHGPRFIEEDQWPAKPEIVTGPKGSVVLAHGAWWHCARDNQTNRSRSGLLGMYMRKCIVPQEPLREQLAQIEAPSDELIQLMGGNCYVPKTVAPWT